MRWLLVEAAWRILRSPRADAAGLKAWGASIALRRGKRVAVVALARRLAGILSAMWRAETVYRAPSKRVATAAAYRVRKTSGGTFRGQVTDPRAR